MHDIGRTQLEMHDIGRTQLEAEAFEANGQGLVGFGELESPLSEIQEMELAAELLEAETEQELEQFIGSVMNAVGGAARRFVASDTGRALGGILRGAARQALPVVGRAVGQWFAPGRGGALGADIAVRSGRLFGLELEGLSPEDKEFEVARQFVRFAASATKQIKQAPRGAPPAQAARAAAARAARLYAPGLLPRLRGRSGLLWPRSGRWERRGRTIVLYGGG